MKELQLPNFETYQDHEWISAKGEVDADMLREKVKNQLEDRKK